MGLPAPAQGVDGKRVHVDPKGDSGALAVCDAHQHNPSTDLEAASPARLQSWPHNSSITAVTTCTGHVAPLAHDCGSVWQCSLARSHEQQPASCRDLFFAALPVTCARAAACPLAWILPCRVDPVAAWPLAGQGRPVMPPPSHCQPSPSHLTCLPGTGIVLRCTGSSLLHPSQRPPEVEVFLMRGCPLQGWLPGRWTQRAKPCGACRRLGTQGRLSLPSREYDQLIRWCCRATAAAWHWWL